MTSEMGTISQFIVRIQLVHGGEVGIAHSHDDDGHGEF